MLKLERTGAHSSALGFGKYIEKDCGCSTTASTTAFQAVDEGSIPSTRFIVIFLGARSVFLNDFELCLDSQAVYKIGFYDSILPAA